MTFYSTSVVMKPLKGPLQKIYIYRLLRESTASSRTHLKTAVARWYRSKSLNYVIIIVKIFNYDMA